MQICHIATEKLNDDETISQAKFVWWCLSYAKYSSEFDKSWCNCLDELSDMFA